MSTNELISFSKRQLGAKRLAALDLFDRAQLNAEIEVCQESKSMNEAGRTLFAGSR